MSTAGICYGVGLAVVVTGCVWFTIRFFAREGKTTEGILAALKIGALLYPLAVGIMQVSGGQHWIPGLFWRLYLVVAAVWIGWILFAPERFGTRKPLDTPELKNNPMLCLVFTVFILMLLGPAVVLLFRYVF